MYSTGMASAILTRKGMALTVMFGSDSSSRRCSFASFHFCIPFGIATIAVLS